MQVASWMERKGKKKKKSPAPKDVGGLRKPSLEPSPESLPSVGPQEEGMGTCDHRTLPARRWLLPDGFPLETLLGTEPPRGAGRGGQEGRNFLPQNFR